MADRPQFRICTNPTHTNQPPHGRIFLPNGDVSPVAFSQEFAKTVLASGIKSGFVSKEDETAIRDEIEASGLPIPLTEFDQRTIDGVKRELIVKIFIAAKIEDADDDHADVAADGFDIDMPHMCEQGCHPVILYRDGALLTIDTVRTVAEARDLINRWKQQYNIPRLVARGLRTKAVRLTTEHNRALAAER